MTPALFDARGSVRATCLLRILIGPIVVMHLWPFLQQAREGVYFADSFYVPWFDWMPVPGRELYVALLYFSVACAALMSLGVLSRVTTALTFSFVLWNLLQSQLHFHHNRTYLIAVLLGLTLVDSGRELSLDAWWRRRRGRARAPDDAPLWPLWLMRFLGCMPYLASGTSKLLDPDWLGGVVMMDRIARYRDVAIAKGAPLFIMDILAEPAFHAVFWKIVVASEIFVGLGLWWRRTRYAAVVAAAGFHLLIEVTATVEVFSYVGIAGLLVWATPSVRDRVLWLPIDRSVLRFLVRYLDWLARFRIEPAPVGGPVTVVDRDGSRMVGSRAVRFALSRLPVLALPLLPTLLFRRRRRPGRIGGDEDAAPHAG